MGLAARHQRRLSTEAESVVAAGRPRSTAGRAQGQYRVGALTGMWRDVAATGLVGAALRLQMTDLHLPWLNLAFGTVPLMPRAVRASESGSG